MTETFDIAFLPSEGKKYRELIEALRGDERFTVSYVQPEELSNILSARELLFQAFVVPLELEGGSSGTKVCEQIRSASFLPKAPLIALSPTHDPVTLESLYAAGADIVLTAPFDQKILHLQIKSFLRALDDAANAPKRRSKRTRIPPLEQAMNTLREGMIVFDATGTCIFANEAAEFLLGIEASNNGKLLSHCEDQLTQLLEQHEAEAKTTPEGIEQTCIERPLRRGDGQLMQATIKITTLRRDSGAKIGQSVSISDLSEINILSNRLKQSQRVRALCLLTTAGCFRSMNGASQAPLIAPIKKIEDSFAGEARQCPLSAALTALLETLDLVISPDISIRVKVEEEDEQFAVRPSDFFQLIGHLMLHAVEQAGGRGEVILETGTYLPGKGVPVVITSISRHRSLSKSDDPISRIVRGDFGKSSVTADDPVKIHYGLAAAQRIAERYRAEIEYKRNSDTELKLRVALPPVVKM